MKKSVPAASPEAYVASLTEWRRACVEELRAAVRGAARFEEVIWRGQRLRELEPRLRPGGKYDGRPDATRAVHVSRG